MLHETKILEKYNSDVSFKIISRYFKSGKKLFRVCVNIVVQYWKDLKRLNKVCTVTPFFNIVNLFIQVSYKYFFIASAIVDL